MNTGHEMQEEVIERYLAGKLQGEELAAFEIRMMDDADLFEAVQVAATLRHELKKHLTVPTHRQELELPGSAAIIPFRTWIRQPVSMAASLLVAVLSVHLVMNELREVQAPATQTPASLTSPALDIASVLVLEATRGDDAMEFTGNPPYLFQIDAGPGNEAATFSLEMVDDSGKSVLKQDGLKAQADGWVRLVLAEKLMGTYHLALQWQNGTDASQRREFALRVVSP